MSHLARLTKIDASNYATRLKTRSKSAVDPRWTQWLHNIFDQTVRLGAYDPLEDLDVEDAEILEAA